MRNVFSFNGRIYNGKHTYIQKVSCEAYQRMYFYGSYQIGNTHIIGLRSNQTATRPVFLAENVNNDRTCSGTTYGNPYGTKKP